GASRQIPQRREEDPQACAVGTKGGSMSGGTGNDDDGPKVSRAHVEPRPSTTPERTVTWPVKDGDALIGTVRLSKGVHECVLPDGSVVETFKSLNFAVEFLRQRGQPISPRQQAADLSETTGGRPQDRHR